MRIGKTVFDEFLKEVGSCIPTLLTKWQTELKASEDNLKSWLLFAIFSASKYRGTWDKSTKSLLM
jgi:hypothetical protein